MGQWLVLVNYYYYSLAREVQERAPAPQCAEHHAERPSADLAHDAHFSAIDLPLPSTLVQLEEWIGARLSRAGTCVTES